MKMKEGREGLAGADDCRGRIAAFGGHQFQFRGGQGGNWLGFLISLVATVLMWVPNSQSWFAAARGSA